jgi:hypothetical protein
MDVHARSSVNDLGATFGRCLREKILHLLQLFGRMPHPFDDFANDPQWFA